MSRDYPSDRRQFVQTVIVGAAAASALTACGGGGDGSDNTDSSPTPRFTHGVASGDPLQTAVILWTRAVDATDVEWEVATDADFTQIAAAGNARTGANRDYTVKVDATDLRPNTAYYYRFFAEGVQSPVGRTKTLPNGTVSQAKIAVFSCSNYPAGYFHVYGEVAKRDDIDVVLHLGDYIYEYSRTGYANEDADALGRTSEPANEILTLRDYRQRYAQYRSDADLQAIHARHPWITVWDDHETANDAYRDGAENHDAATEGTWADRRAAALQAYNEWLPLRPTISGDTPQNLYRRFDFGDLATLYMLETRLTARTVQLDYANFTNADGSFNGGAFGLAMADPSRTLLGSEQFNWLQSQMAASTATWQVLGQQVLMGRMNVPSPLVTFQVTFGEYTAIAAKAQTDPTSLTATEQAILAAPSIPYNLDAWDGYVVERERIFGVARALNKNLVALAGDTHNAWANNLTDLNNAPVGVEFATPSVSSPGLENIFVGENMDAFAAGLTQLIGPLQYTNLQHRGYLTVTFTPAEARADWTYVSTVKARSYSLLTNYAASLRTLPGQRQLTAVSLLSRSSHDA